MPGSTSDCANDITDPSETKRKVVYVYDPYLGKSTDKIAHISGRSRMVHELIKAYELLQLMECKVGKLISREDLLKFHSQDYVDFLFSAAAAEAGSDSVSDKDESDEDDSGSLDDDINNSSESHNSTGKFGISSSNCCSNALNMDEFGLGYDCPIFKGLGDFVLRIAGATVTAAEELVNGADVAINWCGGWHHGQRSEASGFCYVNDIVLGIHELQKKFKHILYVDLDCHHGDGVENAFAFSNKVTTLSFHHFETGYFPGTGRLKDVGQGRGKYFSFNVPLKAGLTDSQFMFIFDSIFNNVTRNVQPDAIVVQCGADCLAKDPLGAFNLTLQSLVHCVRTILNSPKRIPTMLLGGGGYKVANAARLWTSITAEVVNQKLNNDIPDNMYFLKYGPDYELCIQPSLQKNDNDQEYLSELIASVSGHMLSLRNHKIQKGGGK